MHDRHERPRVAASEQESGVDVWLPALVALIAVLFMLFSSAKASEAGDAPQPIYDTARFDAAAIAAESAAADAARRAPSYAAVPGGHGFAAGIVEVAALPAISAAIPAATPVAHAGHRAVDRSIVIRGDQPRDSLSLARVLAPAAIAGLLLLALVALGRTWRRTEPLAAV